MVTVQALPAVTETAQRPILVFNCSGATVAHLGTGEPASEKALQQLLGRPSAALVLTPGLHNCGVDAMASWHALIAYFDHDRLVGLSLGPGSRPAGRTSEGLALGGT